ncbi:MAG TPA: hypothetical protein DD412_00145 [Holosporales bacterium]|nr:hypothetical protein [Holosporales bacterium]
MKQYILNHMKIAIVSLLILYPQGVFSSDKGIEEDVLEVGSTKVPLKSFVNTLFSEAFDGKRAQTLVQLSKHTETKTLYQNPLFQTALREMEEGKRNTFIMSLPFEEKNLLKPYIHWSLLGSLGKAESSKAEKSVLALQELDLDNVEGMVASLDNSELRALFGTLFSLDDTPPAHDAPFLERYFYEQKGDAKILSEDLADQSDLLKKAEKGSEAFYNLVGQLNFLGKRLYAANNPKDHTLENFPDGLLFGFSHELAHLELTYYFLKNVAEREDRKIDALAVQLKTAEGDLARQKRLNVLLNTTMLKREIVASSAVALDKFLSLQSPLDAYVALGNFFHKYIAATTDPHASSSQLPAFHAELCELTFGLSLTPPDLLDMGLSSPKDVEDITVIVDEGSGSGESIEVLSVITPSDYDKASKKLKEVAQTLGKEAISHNSMEQAQRAGLVEHAALIAQKAKEASDKGNLELANRLIERLQKIKEELSTL